MSREIHCSELSRLLLKASLPAQTPTISGRHSGSENPTNGNPCRPTNILRTCEACCFHQGEKAPQFVRCRGNHKDHLGHTRPRCWTSQTSILFLESIVPQNAPKRPSRPAQQTHPQGLPDDACYTHKPGRLTPEFRNPYAAHVPAIVRPVDRRRSALCQDPSSKFDSVELQYSQGGRRSSRDDDCGHH
jgi:hypothetical protein